MDAIEQMREDFRLVAADLLAEGWTEADIAAFGDSIKAALESGEADRIAAARTSMAAWAAPIRALLALGEGINERIRASLEAQRGIEFYKSREAA